MDGVEPEEASARPRRFAKACDTCFKRKVKCEGTAPPCRQCQRRGQPCTFTRAEIDLSKPRRAGRQLKVVSERLQYVEALLAEARQREHSEALSDGHDRTSQHAGEHGSTTTDVADDEQRRNALTFSAKIQGDILAQPIPHDMLIVMGQYSEEWHRFFPYFNLMALVTSMLQPRSRSDGETAILRVCVRAVLSIALRMATFSPIRDTSIDCNKEADRQLGLALSDSGCVVAAKPSMLSVQTLMCISTSMALSAAYNPTQASVMLATTFQAARFIGMDSQDDLAHESVAEQVHRRVLFRSLHVLDQDLSIRLDKSPISGVTELDIAEEVEVSIGKRRVVSLDKRYSIDVFGARCELARIQMRVRTLRESLESGIGRFARTKALDNLNEMLNLWCTQYLPPVEDMVATQWPPTIYVHLVRLFLAHFRTLLWFRSPGYADLRAMDNFLEEHLATQQTAMLKHQGPPMAMVACARDVLTVVASVGRNEESSWLQEALQEISRGCLVMYQAVVHMDDLELATQEFTRTNSWLESLTKLHSLKDVDGLSLAVRVLKRLRLLALLSLESVKDAG